jgi:hypothetical protein
VPGDGSRKTCGHVAVAELPWTLVAGAVATRHVAAPELSCAKGRTGVRGGIRSLEYRQICMCDYMILRNIYFI